MSIKSLKDFLKEYKAPNQFAHLSFTHYFFQDRAERLDLITNNMLGFSAKRGSKQYLVGDVSDCGFSYIQPVPHWANMTPRRVRRRIEEVTKKNEGRTLEFGLFYLGDPTHPELKVSGKIVNHQVFISLSHQEIEREIGFVLYKKGVKRGQDPHHYYEKMELMLRGSFKMGRLRKWDQVAMIAMNVAFLNLIGEIGAPPELFERVIDDYPGRTLYVKYGVFVSDKEAALKLFSFAKYKDPDHLMGEQKKWEKRVQNKQIYFEKVNQQFDSRTFLQLVWKRALRYYDLSLYIPFPHPTNKEDSASFMTQLQTADGHVQQFADHDYREQVGPNEFELFLSEALYWHLIDKDKKYLNKSLIVTEVQGIMASCFMEAMAEAGWKDEVEPG